MEPDLKQRLTGRIFLKVTVSFLIGITNYVQAQTADSSEVNRVEVIVVAREKVVNYDSIFQKSTNAAGSRQVPKAVRVNTQASTGALKQSRSSNPSLSREEKEAVPKVRLPDITKTASGAVSNTLKTNGALSVPKTAPAASSADARIEKIEHPAVSQRDRETEEYIVRHNPSANTISYLWIGFVLIIGGIVLGLIFGRTAFMVSIIGVVFLIIGFYVG